MPFTVSHVAAVLPLKDRGRLRTLPLVIGSMAPDVAMVVGAPALYDRTHSALGTVTVDPLVTALLAAAWVWWLRAPVVGMLPRGVRLRLPAIAARRWRPGDAWWWYLSACLGAATHVLIDTFTHDDRAEAVYSGLVDRVGRLTVAHWLQYALGVLGLLVLAWWVARWYRRTPPRRVEPGPLPGWWAPLAWCLVVGAALVVGALRARWTLDLFEPPLRPWMWQLVAQRGVYGLFTGTLGALGVLGLLLRLLVRERRDEGREHGIAEQDEPNQVQRADVR